MRLPPPPRPDRPVDEMSPDALIFGYVVVLLAALSAVAIYFEHRRRRFEPTPSEDHIFRCEKCGFVYTDDGDVERSRCSQCGTVNNLIEF
jgi:hypothetical protein